MIDTLFTADAANTILIHTVLTDNWEQTLAELPPKTQSWLKVHRFEAKSGTFCLVPGDEGHLAAVFFGLDSFDDHWPFGLLSKGLPEGDYRIDTAQFTQPQLERICYAWGLGAYTFDRYKKYTLVPARLCIPESVNQSTLSHRLESYYLIRNLINTPAEDLRPTVYADLVKDIAKKCGAKCDVITGKKLEAGFPLVHAVGRAGEQAPCVVDLRWGDESHPKLTLVGKGVCFDSGGLNIKTGGYMRRMKKDMGGSANVLGLAQMIMLEKLPVRLRLILPMAENAIAGNAMRPDDVFKSRLGKTVEVGNTDAEGRLILADALAFACEEEVDYLIDMATLTGAARVALGPDIPVFFSSDKTLTTEIEAAAEKSFETVCELPLYTAYRPMLDSKIADICNMSSMPYGGAMTAALFLKEFVPDKTPWAHFDINAWFTRTLPGRPEGGDAMGFATLYEWVLSKFGA